MGEHALSDVIKMMCQQAGIEINFINHSLRVSEATLFKPGTRWPQAGAPGFLKLILCRLSVCVLACVCVCVCVSAPEAINNQWHDVA